MSRYKQRKSNKYLPIVIVLIVLILIATVIWLFQRDEIDNSIKTKTIEIPQQDTMLEDVQEGSFDKTEQAEPVLEISSDSEKKQTESPEDRLKIKSESLVLENSDESFRTAVWSVSENLLEWFQAKDVIKKFIVLINDFSQNQMLYKNRTFIKPPGKILVNRDAKGLYLAEHSYNRYDSLANAIVAIDLQKGIDLYVVFKPLFEKVYKDFAYPAEYRLDDIFMKAAASVIEAPIITNRISLVKHTVSYKFADKKLESLNDVEKLMIRMGPQNTKKIQSKLRKLVEAVAGLKE